MPVFIKFLLLHNSMPALLIEGALLLAALVLCLAPRAIVKFLYEICARAFKHLAGRKWLSLAAVFLLALGLRAAFLPMIPPGAPEVQDEFSYLLAADTFASGRLTNPTHPMWKHFETMHVIHNPTYQSKYPPGQGLVLAAGQAIAGSPWAGVWVSCALMCAALLWMLRGWLPSAWALFGGLLIALRFCTVHDWSTAYWGGAAAAIGGAMVLGALPRIMKKTRISQGVVFGLGLVILANTRPFEGMILGLAAGLVLLGWMLRQNRRIKIRALSRIGIPVLLILIIGGAATMTYFKAVTGDPLKMPYMLHIEQYEVAKPILWMSPDPPKKFNHPVLDNFWNHYHLDRFNLTSASDYLAVMKHRLLYIWFDCLWPGLIWPLIFLPFALGNKSAGRLLFIVLAMAPIVFITAHFFLHYIAPGIGAFYALILMGMQAMTRWEVRGKKIGAALVAAIAVSWIIVPCLLALSAQVETSKYTPFRIQRQSIPKNLEQDGDRHLIIVRYGPNHNVHEEWVFNRADIDAAKVVWAREMDPESDAELIKYFKDRKVWLLEVDLTYTKQRPYDPQKELRLLFHDKPEAKKGVI